MARQVKDFSRAQLYKIAFQYATSEHNFSHSYFENECQISKSTFYNILKKAVVENIVPDNIVEKMAKKAVYNSSLRAGTAGRQRSERYYSSLRQKRRVYMLPKKKAIDLTESYAESKLTKIEFCKRNYITPKLFDRTLLKAIIENWVSDDIFEKLQKKSIQKNSKRDVTEFWEKLRYFRNENRKNQG